MEIERKFLIKEMPANLDKLPKRQIVQGYLSTKPVVRVRKDNDDYYLTYKGGGMMARMEENLPLTSESFYHLLRKCDGRIISKTRYNCPLEPECDTLTNKRLTAEIDIFDGELSEFQFLEVEFESIDQANAFIPPAWFGEDVTNNPKYHNSNMVK